MKKRSRILILVMIQLMGMQKKMQAQIPVLEIIKAGITKVIKAVDLKVQRLQNQTIWLQNAEKVLENEMSKLKLGEITGWVNKQKELYANYFDELSKVRAVISGYQAVRDVINGQRQLVKEYATVFKLSKKDKNFTPEEIDYMGQVYAGILEQSLKSLEQLGLAINAFTTQMTDAKRMVIIHSAADDIEKRLTDLRQFNQQNIRISLQRAKQQNDVDAVRKLYGIG
jgi:flagellar biosynthesis/type III secretory pathway chaperone